VPGEARIIESIVSATLKRIAWRHGAMIHVEAKCDAYCKRIIFVPRLTKKRGKIVAAKKRYGYTDEKDNLYVVGLAPRRSSTPKLTRQLMLDWLFKILVHKDVEGAIALVRDTWYDLPNRPLNLIGLPRGLHKVEYSSRNPWLDGCNYMTKRFSKVFREDKKPLLIYMKGRRQTKRKPQKVTMKRRKQSAASYMKGQKKIFDMPRKREGSKRLDKQPSIVHKSDQEQLFISQKGCDTDVVCITETDETVPEVLREHINWEKMRNLVLKNHFKPMFDAIGVTWSRVLTKKKQVRF